MTDLVVGHLVTIVGPKGSKRYKSWIPFMDQLIGSHAMIYEIDPHEHKHYLALLDGCKLEYFFFSEWLELLHEIPLQQGTHVQIDAHADNAWHTTPEMLDMHGMRVTINSFYLAGAHVGFHIVSDHPGLTWAPGQLIIEDDVEVILECTCDRPWVYGCTCGAMEAEMKAKGKRWHDGLQMWVK